MQSTKTVLIIDDEFDIREIAKISLQITKRWTVLTAASGPEGLDVSIHQKPDAILLDVIMPDYDGLATLAILKDHPQARSIPVILLTATRKMAMDPEYFRLGIQGILIKPFDPGILGEQIEEILHWHPIKNRG